ncbi:MAG: translation initiation factor IF-6 [Nanoarchaeota archaeon]|nr:translation initiation factor IF-6 [Nanoarchaeota archaeon]
MRHKSHKARHIFRTNVHGNPNVGLCGFATDEYCLIGAEFTKEQADEMEKVLKVPVHRISMCGTSLIGVFVAGNSKCLIVPSIAFDYELRVLEELKIKYEVLDTKLTALGNNILCNDAGCLVSPEFPDDEVKKIKKYLGVPVQKGTVAELDIVGVMAAFNTKGGVINRDIKKKELQTVEKLLGIKFAGGTVNIGTPQVRAAIICNSNGFVVGTATSGPEMTNIDETLGFI